MKVTNYGPGGIPLALGGWSTGIVSLNSNVDTIGGGPSALNFVQRITANTSNTLLNPIVNFASGTGISLAAASNTITISSSGGGGTVSAGSNSTRVSEDPSAGASTTLWSPYDHRHDGIGTITASSSNTLQRGTVNLRAGTNVTFTLTDSDGDGEVDTVTVNSTSTGGGGGATQSYVGYNTIGGTWTTVTTFRQYMKKVTFSAAANLQSIDLYVRPSVDNLYGIHVGILSDNAGSPDLLIGGNSSGNSGFYMSNSATMPGAGRWLSIPMGGYYAAGDYWITFIGEFARFDIANDGSGSDRFFTTTVFSLSAPYPTAFPITTTALRYSMRASILT